MKKILILFLSIILIPINVFAETCNAEGVTVQSIEMIEKAAGAAELSAAKVNGTVIDLDVSFTRVDDYIKYKTTIKNNTDVDYVLDESMFNKKYTNVKYTFETDDKMVKAGAARDLTLVISLTKNPTVDKFNETNSFDLDLTGGEIVNPPTGVKSLLYMLPVLIIISLVVLFISKKKTSFKTIAVILALVITIPTVVKAIYKCNLKINSTVTVEGCKYKLTTDIGSFEEGSDVREICVGANEIVASEKLTCKGPRFYFEGSPSRRGTSRDARVPSDYTYLYLILSYENHGTIEPVFNDNSYIKVYSDENKTKLIKTVTKDDIMPHYYSLEDGKYLDLIERYMLIPIGEYDDAYVTLSKDLRNKVEYTVEHGPDPEEVYYEGSCPSGANVVTSEVINEKISNLIYSNDQDGLVGFTNCVDVDEQEELNPVYPADMAFASTTSTHQVCTGNKYKAIWYNGRSTDN